MAESQYLHLADGNVVHAMELKELKNKHKYEDIYVLGSGPSLTYVDPSFFCDKIVVATNSVADRLKLYDMWSFPHIYTHSHYHDELHALADRYIGYYIAPEGDQGHAGGPNPRHPMVIYYPHPATSYDFVVEKAVHPDGLIVGSTSMHGAMHLAAHMGAANIIMVGADCGMIDGKFNQEGYTSGNLETSDPAFWLDRWETHLRQVKAYLCDRYEVNIYSLNPFLNMNLEGHEWRGSNPITQRSRAGLCKTCGMECADLH